MKNNKKKIIAGVSAMAIAVGGISLHSFKEAKYKQDVRNMEAYIQSDIATLESVRRSLEIQKHNINKLGKIEEKDIIFPYDTVGDRFTYENKDYIEVGLENKDTNIISEALVDVTSKIEVIPANKYHSIGGVYADANENIYVECYNQIEGQYYPALVDVTNMQEIISCEDKMNLEKYSNIDDNHNTILKYDNVETGYYKTLTLKPII